MHCVVFFLNQKDKARSSQAKHFQLKIFLEVVQKRFALVRVFLVMVNFPTLGDSRKLLKYQKGNQF